MPECIEKMFKNGIASLIINGSPDTVYRKVAVSIAQELAKNTPVFYFSFYNEKPPFKPTGKRRGKRNIKTKQLDYFILKHSPEEIKSLYEFVSGVPANSTVFIDGFDDVIVSYRMRQDIISPEELAYLIQKDIVEGCRLNVIIPTRYRSEELRNIVAAFMEVSKKERAHLHVQCVTVSLKDEPINKTYLLSTDGKNYTFHKRGNVRIFKGKKHRVIKDSGEYISTGIKDLDTLLGGGLKRGSYNVLELSTDVIEEAYRPIVYSMILNNILKKRGVFIAPAESSSSEDYFEEITKYIDAENLKYLKILKGVPAAVKGKWFIDGYSPTPEGRLEIWKMVMKHLTEISNGPVLDITEYGAIESSFSKNEVIRLVSQGIKWMTEWKNVGVGILSEESEVKDKIMYLSNRYLRIRTINSLYCIEGVKPATPPHIIDISEDKNGLKIRLRKVVV